MTSDAIIMEMDIHTACSLGDEGYVEQIIQRIDVNVKNTSTWTPLMYACFGGHVSVAAVLVQAGANKHQLNSLNQTPLMLAVRSGSLPLVQLVFERNVLDVADCHSKTALYYAVEFNYLEIVQYLIAEGANTNVNCGKNPLWVAVKSDLGHMVEVLLSQRPLQEVSTNHFTKTARHSVPTQQDLKKVLEALSLEKYWPQFQNNNVDFHRFIKMNESDLKSVGINLLGPRRKMYLAIKAFNKENKL